MTATSNPNLIFIGYSHASLIGILRPDVKYPDRKVRQAKAAHTTILANPCICNDDHVKVWVERA